MSKVIKDNDGVAVVEGTPAASLVKDVEKFFASKPPERMAGESISQPRKIDRRSINTRSPIQRRLPAKRPDEERVTSLEKTEQMNNPTNFEEYAEKSERTRSGDRKPIKFHGRPVGGNPKRNEAREIARSRRRFFERRRSRKEAERSQTEQEATQGKFITTLGR